MHKLFFSHQPINVMTRRRLPQITHRKRLVSFSISKFRPGHGGPFKSMSDSTNETIHLERNIDTKCPTKETIYFEIINIWCMLLSYCHEKYVTRRKNNKKANEFEEKLVIY